MFEYLPPRLCATAWLVRHEFCVLSSILGTWFLVLSLKHWLWGKGSWSPTSIRSHGIPSPWPSKMYQNSLFEPLAAFGSSWEPVVAFGIASGCQQVPISKTPSPASFMLQVVCWICSCVCFGQARWRDRRSAANWIINSYMS